MMEMSKLLYILDAIEVLKNRLLPQTLSSSEQEDDYRHRQSSLVETS